MLLALATPGATSDDALLKPSARANDVSDWYLFQPPSDPQSTIFDLSFLNERPVGRHGRVVARNGRFEFEDGTPISFWGTNLAGANCFPSHSQAEQTARRLARLGVNLVRLHHMDAPWASPNIFDPAHDDTQHFSADSLDKLDYLIAQLKRHGIYVFPDLLVHRKFKAGDNVPDYQRLENGAKGVAHFSRRIIELNKRYATMLLTHRNAYTGLTLAEDPMMVCTVLVNESSIFMGFDTQDFPPSYEAELQALYEARGGTGLISRFAFDYDSRSLRVVRNVENAEQSLRILSRLVEESNAEMRAHLRSLGVRAPITGSNMNLPVLAELRANAKLDFIDTHFYWDHPRVWQMPGEWEDIDRAPFDNRSQLRDPLVAMIPRIAEWRVDGLPLTVSEWNHCFPNEWRFEGPILAGAFGSLQGWDAMLTYEFSQRPIGRARIAHFNIDTWPDIEPIHQVAALIFRRRDISPSETSLTELIGDDLALAPASASSWLHDNAWTTYATRFSRSPVGSANSQAPTLGSLADRHDTENNVITSVDGTLRLDYRQGSLTIDAPRVQGFVGRFLESAQTTSRLTLTPDRRNPAGVVLIISLDNAPLEATRRALLVAVARAENTGQAYNSSRTALTTVGETPIRMQGILADVALDLGKSFRVRALDKNGRPGASLHVARTGAKGALTISPEHLTSLYLLER